MEGQKLEDKQLKALEALPQDAPFMTKMLVKHRRIIGIEQTRDGNGIFVIFYTSFLLRVNQSRNIYKINS